MSSSDAGFRGLYEREFANVFRAAHVVSGRRDVAEDAAQEAFARALARWRRLGKEPWVAGWVTTTAINVARRQLRRRPDAAAPSGREVDIDATLDVRRAIQGLPRRQQEAVILHYLLDLPIGDAAQAMGCRPGTVKAHLSRARAALAPSLESEGSEGARRDAGRHPEGESHA
jgi:RNA polymerase sigma factor (sigma-70 family)